MFLPNFTRSEHKTGQLFLLQSIAMSTIPHINPIHEFNRNINTYHNPKSNQIGKMKKVAQLHSFLFINIPFLEAEAHCV